MRDNAVLLLAVLLAACGPTHGAATPGACRENADADEDAEQQREAAAIDDALRAQGLTRPELSVALGPVTPGKPFRADDGTYELVVETVGGCSSKLPIVAMTAQHEVFVVMPTIVAQTTRVVTECTSSCRGACGMPMPDRAVLARVPSDAVLDPPRNVRVPMDVQVTFRVAKQFPCNVP